MVRQLLILTAILTFTALYPARADILNLDLAQDHINITTGFTGSQVSVYGTKKAQGEIVLVVEGPSEGNIVRRKDEFMGAWINLSSLEFDETPSYYDYATNVENLGKFMPEDDIKANHIGVESLTSAPIKDRYNEETTKNFQDALIRTNQTQQLYPLEPQEIFYLDDDFFRVDFELPANVPTGDYTVKALLINNGEVVQEVRRSFTVAQVGLGAKIRYIASEHSFLYGCLCVVIALMAGWLSNIFVRKN